MKNKIFKLALMALIIAGYFRSHAQHVVVDEKGVMRWEDTREEVYGFGINYSVPFAHAYRSAEKLDVSHEKAIENDVYHFARLGFDAYRVHVWDTEISDTLGNLLENEHLRLFDYTLHKMKERGIKFIITPIAFWGNGWPEPDEKTPGFSHKYGKAACLTNEDAIRAQENYLEQFVSHVNPYTGLPYKDDPSVIAFEVSNEPHHRQEPDSVTRYIRKMVDAIRSAGCEKPVFYNISHSIHLVDAYFNAGIQGGTFQWYPTGLVSRYELQGNFLPHVDEYRIPFADNSQFAKGAKMVYEFDAADIGRSYIYPAMARSFRTAGIQWAAYFSYDPTYMAYANTEYNTHYMNLAYTPQKALSLKISGEVFHRVPLYKDYGKYPDNTRFDAFTVNYEKDLAEMATEDKFFYTNNTDTRPPSPQQLKELAGYGDSPLVKYDGTGAYFIDRIEKGVWRLEVMPDAVWIGNPFGYNSLDRAVAAINWRTRTMKIDLPDLGHTFSIQPVNKENNWTAAVREGEFEVRPGVYLLTREGVKSKVKPDQKWKNIRLNEYFAPQTTLDKQYVLHEPPGSLSEGAAFSLQASVISVEEPESVEAVVYSGYQPQRYELTKQGGYTYSATIPGSVLEEGVMRYFIVVKGRDNVRTYPQDHSGEPGDWDFDASQSYQAAVAPKDSRVYLFNALTDNDKVSRPWAPGSMLAPLDEPGKGELRIHVEQLFKKDPENPNGRAVRDYSMRYFFGNRIDERMDCVKNAREVVFRGRSLSKNTGKVQVALVSADGKAFGSLIDLNDSTREYRIPLEEFREVDRVILPRPYPTFLPYYFEHNAEDGFDLTSMEALQISIGPGLSSQQLDGKQGLAVESVWLE